MKKSISGIRGIFGNDLTLKEVIEFCNNFSALVKSKKCTIAQDTRPSGRIIRETVKATLMQNGIDVFDLGTVPTPVAFRESRKYGAGVIVSSSHNPLEWNGLKFIVDGRGINEKELEVVLNQQSITKSKIGNETRINSDYVNDAIGLIGKISNPPNVVVDIGGGAALDVAPKLLKELGCNVQVINDTVENSSRGPDPTADELVGLIEKSNGADIGFAFDLDSDRLVVVKDGKKQTPDVTLGLGVAKALELGYKNYVLSIDTSVSIEKFIIEHGGKVQRAKVGEANVIEMMLESNAQAGGEGSSGGFILPEFNYCREGILTSGLIASMLGGPEFLQVLKFMESYHQIRDKVAAESNLHDKTLEKVTKKMKEQFSDVITIDGIKGIIDEDSWVLVRKSNTEDIIRVSAESNDKEKAEKMKNETKKLVEQCYDEVK